ncbi:MAG: T9SS type A sorting domain-containing protein [Flavobacterium sp.]|nr:T9SS type A sorting domain-containing protein [Pedobacter sp.]
MKGKLLTTFGFILGALYASAQSFTPGNLAVYRYGNGTAALGNSVTVPVFIDEYTPSLVLVKSRAIPSTDNGANLKFTGLGRDGTSKYVDEGISTLSQDGKYLTIFGYNQIVGGAVPSTSNGLVVGVIAADGSFNSTTTLSNDPTTGMGSPRSAVFDGTADIWANGSQNGIQYTTLGATTSTRISTAQSAAKSLAIAKASVSGTYSANRLYVANGGVNSLYSGTSKSELAFAIPLPKTSTTFDISAPFTSVIAANQVAIVSILGRTIIYVADDANSTIRRYYLSTDGSGLGTYTAFTDATNFNNIKSITASVGGTSGSNTLVNVYATTWGDNGTGAGTSKLLKFTDAYATATLTTNSSATFATSASITSITAPTNTLFKSVSFVPSGSTAIGTAVLPVNLTSFNGKKSGDNVILNWATLSEQNNSYFDVLRSGNGKEFTSIGKVTGNGNSNSKINYSFTDKSPEFGANYYHLNQVDFNGKSTASETVAVNFGFAEDMVMLLSPLSDNTGVSITVDSPAIIEGKVIIYSISGQQSAAIEVKLEKGKNSFNIPAKLQPGVYVVNLNTAKGTISQKISLK